MYRRVEVFSFVIFVGFMVAIYSGLFRGMFIVTDYGFVSQALVFLLVGGFQLYLGIKKTREAKSRGEHISWWKQFHVVSALSLGCLAAMMLARQLIPDQVNNVLRVSTLFFFLLLSLGLVIYGFLLVIQQSVTNRPKQPHEDE
jgi:uncharacterized membrane-anchored protein